jgi:hypothetical protein
MPVNTINRLGPLGSPQGDQMVLIDLFELVKDVLP